MHPSRARQRHDRPRARARQPWSGAPRMPASPPTATTAARATAGRSSTTRPPRRSRSSPRGRPPVSAAHARRGFNSTLYGFLAIALFMIAYYRVFGLISVAALSANVMLLIALLLPEERETLDDYRRLADAMNRAGERCAAANAIWEPGHARLA